ncbi:aminotransferase class III-fold pyridoxal phosphate-dependent enzyme [Amylibacter sp.]|nr:aminotransferase class III-fold pyridoxal phosphate-dependent enzyme [Amylibacter sp.]
MTKKIRNKGFDLYQRAKNVIPGGNMLLSKRPEMFLPDYWPNYFSSAQNCTVTDLDGIAYTDMSIMGIGTNSLGYGNNKVDQAVRNVVETGNMSTLNCPEEVYLAEKLVELHPWADMVKFARTGGEANAIAIRLARAASGKNGVAICGYHGWHDWYLAANLRGQDDLGALLLPGLETVGVPECLKELTHTFAYNDIEGLKELTNENQIGVIIMEVKRNVEPKDQFLEKVRHLASEKGIVLIFDECTSGFRSCYGGLHKLYGVEPDLAMFGKALGNGYAITAVIGKKSVMEYAQTSFISSTFWTERIGPAAGVATLDEMKMQKSWKRTMDLGNYFRQKLEVNCDDVGLPVNIFGLESLPNFSFGDNNGLVLKTLFTQEMLKKGYLASTLFFASTAHSEKIIDDFFETAYPILDRLADCNKDPDLANKLLDGPICHDGFKRLN